MCAARYLFQAGAVVDIKSRIVEALANYTSLHEFITVQYIMIAAPFYMHPTTSSSIAGRS